MRCFSDWGLDTSRVKRAIQGHVVWSQNEMQAPLGAVVHGA